MNLKLIHADHLSLQLQGLINQVAHSRQSLRLRQNLALAGYAELHGKLLSKNEFEAVELLEEIIRDIHSLNAAQF